MILIFGILGSNSMPHPFLAGAETAPHPFEQLPPMVEGKGCREEEGKRGAVLPAARKNGRSPP
jgi:hypothetical protein